MYDDTYSEDMYTEIDYYVGKAIAYYDYQGELPQGTELADIIYPKGVRLV